MPSPVLLPLLFTSLPFRHVMPQEGNHHADGFDLREIGELHFAREVEAERGYGGEVTV